MNFKNYITSILYVASFGIILELFLPKNNLKKYVSSIISVLIIITIISPIFSYIKDENFGNVIDEAIYAISSDNIIETNNKFEFDNYANKVIVSRVKENLEKELYNEFKKELKDITEVVNVEVKLDTSYHIEEVVVYIEQGDIRIAKLLIDKIVSKYEISSNMLRIVKKGAGDNGEIY